MNAVEKFYQVAGFHKERTILYAFGSEYTYGKLIERMTQISDSLPDIKDRTVLAVSTSNPVEIVLYYLTAVKYNLDFLPLSPHMQSRDKKHMCQTLQLSGNMPVHGYSLVHLGCMDESRTKGNIIFCTGGTSGYKKYVSIPHETLYQRCMETYAYDRPEADLEMLLIAPIWRYMGFKELLRMLLLNRKVSIAPYNDLEEIINIIKKRTITYLVTKSSILSNIMYHSAFRMEYLTSLQALRYCQEPLPMETLMQIQALFPDLQFYSDYGLTETMGTIGIMDPQMHKNAILKHHIPTIGKFLDEVDVAIKDEQGNDVDGEEVGELHIHVAYQCREYLGGDSIGYWVPTGDMGWLDKDGYFNLSGFRQNTYGSQEGQMYILPAMARKKYVGMPVINQLSTGNTEVESLFQNMLALIHASLDIDEIRKFYFEIVPQINSVDAYGFELFPIEIQAAGWKNVTDQSWYQDALKDPRQHEVYLLDQHKILTINEMENDFSSELNVLYIPLFASNTQLHGALSFVKTEGHGKFTAREITLLKLLAHHVNLAILNARIFREIQTRQIMLQNTIDFSGVGTVLSDLNDTVYYMNSVVRNMIDKEDVSSLQNSSMLDRLKDNIYHMKISGKTEIESQFACYFKGIQLPTLLRIRSVQLTEQQCFVAHFISQSQIDKDFDFGDLEAILSRKEMEVLQHLCQGKAYREIADALGISVNTINFHIKNIYRKMNVNSRNELLNEILYLGKNGLKYMPENDLK